MLTFVDVPVPGSSGAPADAPPHLKSTPVPDTIRIATTRVPNPALPRTIVPSPHAEGSVVWRDWHKYKVQSAFVQRNALYKRFPHAVRHPDGTLGIEWTSGWPMHGSGAGALEAIAQRVRTQPAFPGPRGACYGSGAFTALALPRSGSPMATLPSTYWALLYADGWLVHGMADGEMRTLCGPESDISGGQWPGAQGARVWRGDFDMPWNWTNDLALDPTNLGAFLVTDAFNRRIARAFHFATGPNVRIRTWVEWPGPFPYSIATAADGTVAIGDRDSGEVRLYNPANPAADNRRLTMIPGGVASIRRSPTGTWTVLEQRGSMRLLEIASDGSLREIFRAPSDTDPFNYKQHDTDYTGAIGPVGDSLVGFLRSSGDELWRVSFDGTFRRNLDTNGAGSQGGRQLQGYIAYVSDTCGHYGASWVAISREFNEFMASGTAAAGGFLFSNRLPSEPNGWTLAMANEADRGRDVWERGTTAGQPLGPSYWVTAGHNGTHWTGPSPRDGEVPMTCERLVDLGDEGLLAWMRQGRGETVHTVTLADAKAVRQRLRFADDRAFLEGNTPPVGPPPDPPDPPDPPAEEPQVRLVLEPDVTYRVTGGKPV